MLMPADTPRVTRQNDEILNGRAVIMDGSLFEDGKRRVVIPQSTSIEAEEKIVAMLEEHDTKMERIERIIKAMEDL